MPQNEISTPNLGEPVDRLALSVAPARGTAPAALSTCIPFCFADEAEPSGTGICSIFLCFADEA